MDALEKLREVNISSAPIISSDGKSCFGLVDALDLVSFMVKLVLTDKDTGELASEHLKDLSYFRTETFRITHLRSIIDISRRNPLHTLPRKSAVSEAINIFARGTHRILLTDENGKTGNVLSQSDVVRYLYNDPTVVFDELEHSMKQLGFAQKRVQYVTKDTKAIDAFLALHTQGLTSLAVVDPAEGHRLVGSLAASDVLLLADLKLPSLLQPVSEFLQRIQQRKPLVTVEETATLRVLIRKLAQNWAHRAYVVDEQRRPIGIVTLTDIIDFMAKALGIIPTTRALVPVTSDALRLRREERPAIPRASVPERATAERARGEEKSEKKETSAEASARLEKLQKKEEKARSEEGQKKKRSNAPEWMQEATTIM
jgi:CBS domain-containing protein